MAKGPLAGSLQTRAGVSLGVPEPPLLPEGCSAAGPALVGRVPEGGEPWGWAVIGTQHCCPCSTNTTHEDSQPTLGTGSSGDFYHLLTLSVGFFLRFQILLYRQLHATALPREITLISCLVRWLGQGELTCLCLVFQEAGVAEQHGCDCPRAAPVTPPHGPTDHEGECAGTGPGQGPGFGKPSWWGAALPTQRLHGSGLFPQEQQ